MSEAEARVLGSGQPVEVEGKEYTLSPVGLGTLQEVQREAVKAWKRDYLQSYAENLDLLDLDAAGKQSLLENKLDSVAKMGIADIPKRKSFNVSLIDFTASGNPKLYDLADQMFGERPDSETKCAAMIQSGLDQGDCTPAQIKEITGYEPRAISIPYDTWWITATHEGALTFVTASLKIKHEEVTKKDVANWPISAVMEAAAFVEGLTAPAVGNT